MILVSACLLGHKVKYNGGSNDDSLLQAYNVQGRFVAVCPECFAMLPVPRAPMEIQYGTGRKLIQRDMGQRFVVAQVKAARQLHQVQPAGPVLRQQHHRPRDRRAKGVRHQRDLTADDRLHARILRLDRKFQRREQRIRIGQRDGRHAVLCRKIGQFLDRNRAFQQGMFGMCAQVDESGGVFRHGDNLGPTCRTVQLPLGGNPLRLAQERKRGAQT